MFRGAGVGVLASFGLTCGERPPACYAKADIPLRTILKLVAFKILLSFGAWCSWFFEFVVTPPAHLREGIRASILAG
jgi:hypothetical protein